MKWLLLILILIIAALVFVTWRRTQLGSNSAQARAASNDSQPPAVTGSERTPQPTPVTFAPTHGAPPTFAAAPPVFDPAAPPPPIDDGWDATVAEGERVPGAGQPAAAEQSWDEMTPDPEVEKPAADTVAEAPAADIETEESPATSAAAGEAADQWWGDELPTAERKNPQSP